MATKHKLLISFDVLFALFAVWGFASTLPSLSEPDAAFILGPFYLFIILIGMILLIKNLSVFVVRAEKHTVSTRHPRLQRALTFVSALLIVAVGLLIVGFFFVR